MSSTANPGPCHRALPSTYGSSMAEWAGAIHADFMSTIRVRLGRDRSHLALPQSPQAMSICRRKKAAILRSAKGLSRYIGQCKVHAPAWRLLHPGAAYVRNHAHMHTNIYAHVLVQSARSSCEARYNMCKASASYGHNNISVLMPYQFK